MAGSNNGKVEKRKELLKKIKPTAQWEDKKLFKSWLETMSLQDHTHNHIVHISHAKWTRKSKEHSSHEQ